MQARLSGLLIGLATLVLASCGGGGSNASPPASADLAITRFNPLPTTISADFAMLNGTAFSNPDSLRRAALAHLHDSNPTVHYAAVYSLALTVTPSHGTTEMVAMLDAVSIDDRLLAAGALTGIGDKRGLPVLIAALDVGDQLSYRDPPQVAFDFARTELLFFTTQDFGLKSASDLAGVAATKASWESWWQANQSSIHFDPATEKYST